MAHALVVVNEQAVPLRVPARCSFKVHNIERGEAGRSAARSGNTRRGEVGVLKPGLPFGVVDQHLGGGIGLVDVIKTPQMNAFGSQPADLKRGIASGLELDAETHLDTVGNLMVLVEAGDSGVAEKSTTRNNTPGTKAKRRSVRIGAAKNIGQG